ncbi:MAG: DUF881 domain-containing protein [Syntrophomonadaceae bacterium]|nr:DUF881 domain-containing protein [Syntrophomonadaceae bacterium]
MAIVCLILGVMLAIQFRANENSPVNPSVDRWAEITIQLDNLRTERDALADEVISLRAKLEETASHQQSDAIKALNEELIKANMAAGLIPVRGAGVIVTLNDSPQVLQPGDNPNLGLVHDEDLLKVVNELKAAGAEAISINGNRLISTSEIRCAGTTILVNVNRIAPPFVINAIGNPETLKSSLLITGGHLKYIENFGIQYQIQNVDSVEVPAYKGAVKYEYAQPVKKDDNN